MDNNYRLQMLLDESFKRYGVFISHNDASITTRHCMALRHEVFCVDKGFEPLSADGMEQDEYDPSSWHFLLVDKKKGCACGTARLIVGSDIPSKKFLSTEDPYHPDQQNPLCVGEVSRIILSSDYRRASRESSPIMVLLLALNYWALHIGLNKIYTCMEAGLLRMLQSIDGLSLMTIGERVEFRGVRQVAIITAHDLLTKRMAYKNLPPESLDAEFSCYFKQQDDPGLPQEELTSREVSIKTV